MYDPSPVTYTNSHHDICVENSMSHRRDGDVRATHGTQPSSLTRATFGDASNFSNLKGLLRNNIHALKNNNGSNAYLALAAKLEHHERSGGEVEVVTGSAHTAVGCTPAKVDADKNIDGMQRLPHFSMRDVIKPKPDRIID